MIDWQSDLGRRALQRIEHEQVIWLTTISASGFPQPRPVWFVWDGESFLIYTLPAAYKLKHIAHNPNVALNFNATADGDDIQVVLGTARVDGDAPAVVDNAVYCTKYRAGFRTINMSVDEYSAMFSAAVRVTPVRLRGLEPLPE